MTLIGYRSANHPQQVEKRGKATNVDDRATHPGLFDDLNRRFGFTVDVAASAHNTKCARYFADPDNQPHARPTSLFEDPIATTSDAIAVDGLAHPWTSETVWCNPPYSDIALWVAKAWAEQPTANGIVMLLPANRTEQAWWQEQVEPFRDRVGSALTVEFLAGRLRFLKAGQNAIGPNERPPFGCCLLIWAGGGAA